MPYVGHQYYEEMGAGFPLLLLHGHTLDRRMWQAVAPRLGARYRVIMPDLAGHGLSQPSGVPQADDLAALLDGLGVERAAVCGLSMGGGAAVSLAIQHPGRVAALIAVDAALNGYRFPTWTGPKPYIAIARSQGLEAGLTAWLSDPIFGHAASRPEVAARAAAIVRDYPGAAWLQGAWSPNPPGPPEPERLGEVTAPTLVLVGEHDLPDFHQMADLLAQRIAGARRLTVAGSGHMVPMEQPDAFTDAVEQFLDEVLR